MTSLQVEPAAAADAEDIVAIMTANRGETSLFQQPLWEVERALDEFLVARREDGPVLGCIQVHCHPAGPVEILAVAVHPQGQGIGVGSALMRAALPRARQVAGSSMIFLSTLKPGYFARHGFVSMSRWRLPLRLLLGKLPKVFRQPIDRWIPAIFGRPVFMSLHRPVA